jgi:hypothetical protein
VVDFFAQMNYLGTNVEVLFMEYWELKNRSNYRNLGEKKRAQF